MNPEKIARQEGILDELEEHKKITKNFVPSGVKFIDDIMCGGWIMGTMTLIAGRPSMGKTAFALQLALSAAKLGASVKFLSLEMSVQELLYRVIASTSGTSLNNLFSGVSNEELVALRGGIAELSTYRGLDIVSSPANVFDLETMVEEDPTDILVIDYLQLLGTKEAVSNRYSAVSEISSRLKKISVQNDCAVIALCQLNRMNEGRLNKSPRLSDLRDSGSLEQDADLVFLLDSKSYNNDERNLLARSVICDIAKNRNGRTARVLSLFDMSTQSFDFGRVVE